MGSIQRFGGPGVFRFAVAVAALLACGTPSTQQTMRTGLAKAILVSVPSNVQCIVVDSYAVSSPADALTFAYDVTSADSATFSLAGLPVGLVSFSAIAFSTPCATRSPATATWMSDPVLAIVSTDAPVPVALTMRPVSGGGVANVVVGFPAVSVSVNPSSASVAVGASVAFTAQVSNASDPSVTWSVQEGASGGSVTSTGIYAAPATPGTYHVVATSLADATKSGFATVSVLSTPPVTAGAPSIQVHPSGRYLVDAAGAPFFMIGDAAQSAAAALTYADWTSYIDQRVSQGFNTVNVNFIEHLDAPAAPADRDGNIPFTTTIDGDTYASTSQVPDFATPNDAYWKGLEDKVAYAASNGVLVSLALYIWGSGGWYTEVQNNSLAAATSLGTYLASGSGGSFRGFNRYGNVMWVWGADHQFDSSAEDQDVLSKLQALAAAVRSNAPGQLMSGDWGVGIATQQVEMRPLMDLQAVYQYAYPVGSYPYLSGSPRDAYAYVPASAPGDGRALPALPTFMKETGYEGEANPCGTPACVRAYGWTAILNGSTTGYWYGHRDVWDFAYAAPDYAGADLFPPYSPWTASVNSTGAQDIKRLATFIAQVAWWKLVPSGSSAPFIGRTLIANGDDSAVGGPVSAAQAPDGTLLLAYIPATGSGTQAVGVDLRGMAAPVRVRWWDPTIGAFTSAGSFTNTVFVQSFTTPGANSAGDNDWVLVIDVP